MSGRLRATRSRPVARGAKADLNRRVCRHVGREGRAIRATSHNPRHDPMAFDVKRSAAADVGDVAAASRSTVRHDMVGPITGTGPNDNHLGNRRRCGDPRSQSDRPGDEFMRSPDSDSVAVVSLTGLPGIIAQGQAQRSCPSEDESKAVGPLSGGGLGV